MTRCLRRKCPPPVPTRKKSATYFTARRPLAIISGSLIALVDYAAAQGDSVTTTTHEPDGTVVISGLEMGTKYSFSARPPTGWAEVSYPNLPPAFFPRHGDSIDRNINIDARADNKSVMRVKNGQELAALDETEDQVQDTKTRYEAAGTLKTADRGSIPLYSFHRSTSCGLVAYADEGRTITVLTLDCPNDDAVRAIRSMFEQFVASYKSLGPQSHTKRR